MQFEGGGASPDHHGHLARVEVELLASAWCLQDALSEVTKFTSAEVEGLCG